MSQRIGYTYVSTDEQYFDLQCDVLNQAGYDTINEEASSGKSAFQIEPEQFRKALIKGNVLIVVRLDCLKRNFSDFVKFVSQFMGQVIGFERQTERMKPVAMVFRKHCSIGSQM